MKTMNVESKNEILATLQKHAEDWDLEDVEAGEDCVIAKADVLGVRAGGMIPPRLRIVQRNEMLGIEVRNITRTGSTGTVKNRVTHALLRRLVFGEMDEEESKFNDLMEICQLHAHQFLTSPRIPEDLLAAVIEGSNAQVVFTRAVVDSQDGEVYVTACIECDNESLPASFVDTIGAVLTHAARIGRFVRIMRDFVIPEAPPSREEVAKLFKAKEKASANTSLAPSPEMAL